MRLEERYKKEIKDALMKKFEYKSVMQIPKLDKIVINIGMGEAKENPKAIEAAAADYQELTRLLAEKETAEGILLELMEQWESAQT